MFWRFKQQRSVIIIKSHRNRHDISSELILKLTQI